MANIPGYEKIYKNPISPVMMNSEDDMVKARIVYGKAADHKLYLDSEYENQVLLADMADAFKKGMLLIQTADELLVPIAMEDNIVKTIAVTGSAGSLTVAVVEWAALDDQE